MKEFGLIGFPLKNTFSENYFNSKFLSLALFDHSYRNFPLADISELTALLEQHPDLCGLNVTIPYKTAVIPFLDELDASAREAGAVNCIRIEQPKSSAQRRLIGYNTDIYGFEKSLLPLIQPAMPEHALILGTGGASKAVAYALRRLNIAYQLVSRNSSPGIISYAQLDKDIIERHKLIVNCTPLGMFPDTESLPPIPYTCITGEHIAYDLVYLPVETAFLKQCRLQGARAKNGLEMLHLQAEKAWEIWKTN
jgi:shikimate dehydrogenase